MASFNISGRRREGSELMAIYIDESLKSGLFKMHKIQPSRYGAEPGDGHLDLIGFDVEVVDSSTSRFWLLNQRPKYDSKRKPLDASRVGSNTTVEIYEHRRRDKKMTYIATGKSPALHSPNKITFLGANTFAVSNSRSSQVGLRRKLDPILGGGSLVYYDDWFDRYTTSAKNMPLPGMMLRAKDDRIYVPSLVDNKIRIYQLQEDNTFAQVHVIDMEMPIAGLTQDSMGDFWAVGRSTYDPKGLSSTNTIFKIERFSEERYKIVNKKLVLEDKNQKVLSGASIARYDVKSRRIFFAGAYMPFITVCEEDL